MKMLARIHNWQVNWKSGNDSGVPSVTIVLGEHQLSSHFKNVTCYLETVKKLLRVLKLVLKVPKLFKVVACSLLSIAILIFLCHFVVKYRSEFLIAEISF